MKKIKKIYALLICAVLLCSTMMLASCGNDSNIDENGDVTYKVTVKDALGNPYTSGVVVKFMQDDKQVSMQVCDENGVAEKKLEAGDYTAELSFTNGDEGYYYEKKNLSLSTENNELDIIVSYTITEEPTIIYSVENELEVYNLSLGCTYLNLKSGIRNYFKFSPTEAGTYEFSVPDGSNVEIGYYGNPFAIREDSGAEVKDNKFTISMKADMIGDTLIIGVDTKDEQTDHCIFGIERTGDPERTIEDEPWTVYKTTAELSQYQLPEGAEVEEFDLTASTDEYNLVYNENDGFYHLDSEDGPLVLVHLTKNPAYVDCFKKMLESAGVVKYFFDEDGEFVKKENYSDCLNEYIEYADEASGLYPLTEDLKYIIQQRGDHCGWWDEDGLGFIFVDDMGNKLPGLNTEIAWLFMCCYISGN